MIISSRQNPPKMALRRTPTTSSFGPTPLSKYGLQATFLDSPLPSPGLPSILPRHGKKPASRWKRKIVRLLIWIAGLLAILRLALPALRRKSSIATNHPSPDAKSYEIVAADVLPDKPVPIMVTDERGRQKWTVSIPSTVGFPLSPSEYYDICAQCDEISRHVANMKSRRSVNHGYYHKDQNFIDVADAEKHGLLPEQASEQKHHSSGRIVGFEDSHLGDRSSTSENNNQANVCERSLTYVMQTEDAGLGRTLMGLWMSYGLARKEGRAFFVDDTNWAYGRYTTYFKPPPKPNCLPPPPTHRVPCPHQARHLVVSTATAPWTFGDSFVDYFQDSRKAGIARQKPIFDLLRAGYEALFNLADDDASYLSKRVGELEASTRKKGGIQVGVHVRRGDLHPLEFQYERSYIPLEKYADAARRFIESTLNSHPDEHTKVDVVMSSKVVLASDDPEVYDAAELRNAEKAQQRISLASKSAIDAVVASLGQAKKPMEENVGWEGGFFKDIFWSLGAPPSTPAAGSPLPSRRKPTPHPRSEQIARTSDFHFHPTEQALKLRELIGRAYLLDLAVLGHADRIVCGVSSITCRLLAVMMGWDRALLGSGWQNVDGSWNWSGSLS
ncbi:hypothetical protein VTN00DRAFT_5940 [Thermoascus crustaceus]|uniref:uncharacterized protein n=1 Tax=Thermoascus crustaceus TaxID=5088 RepID=UPI00374300BC